MSWKSFLKDYFSFTRADRFGILVLNGCILLALTVRWLLPYWTESQPPGTAAYEEEISRFRQAADSVALVKDRDQTASYVYTQAAPDLFYFDPNRATDEDWEKLGFNGRQIRNIRNYQAKGGNFKRKEDLQKLYTISATQYQRLEPYIRIAGNEPPVKQANAPETRNFKPETKNSNPETLNLNRKLAEGKPETKSPKPETKGLIELNTADSSLLTQLYGIGSVLATRIIKYRNRIGGFANAAQLGEVYGINRELAERLASQLSADTSLIRKIPANTATLKTLTNHPYLNEQQARGILNYRKLQKRINSLNELVQNNILKPEEAEKIKPYLTFD